MKRTYLTLIIVMLVIGFAAVSTIIYINGKTNIGANLEDYSIYFSEAYIDDIERLDVISEDKQKITINTKVLKNIGDSEKLEYDVTNASKQYDAKVSITCEPTENEYYEMEHVFEHDIIKARTYETGYITIKLKKVSVEEQDLEFTCTLKVGALEKTEINTSKVQTRCEYDEGQEWNFDYKGVEQIFDVPCDGTYKLEAWGASGGNASSLSGGKGGYVSGEVELTGGFLYINVGGAGLSNQSSPNVSRGTMTYYNGGYNGGGRGSTWKPNDPLYHIVGTGGGATHIALVSGLLSTLEDKKDKIFIVAGGGGSATYYKTYSGDNCYFDGTGGAAGGLSGYNGSGTKGNCGTYSAGVGGTQISGYSFGQGGTSVSGGGGGLYGGTGSNLGGGGGSSYISNQLKNIKMIDGQGYEWTTTKGAKINMPTHDGTSTMVGNSGNGYARITLVNIG